MDSLSRQSVYPKLHADLITSARDRGVTLHVTAEVLDLEALLALVVIGDAITFVSKRFCEPASHTSLLWRRVEDLHLHLSEVVTWRAADADTPALEPCSKARAKLVCSHAPPDASSVVAKKR